MSKDRELNRKYQKTWYYNNNKQTQMDKNSKIKKSRQAWCNKYKSDIGCKICKESHPACLDFHHRNPKLKKRTISHMVSCKSSIKNILKEIKKCDILCSNCHRKLHWKGQL